MSSRSWFFTLCLAAVLGLFCAPPAFAADAFPLHMQDALHTGITALFAGLTALAGWIVTLILSRLSRKLKIEIDDKVRAYLDEAIRNGIRYAENKAHAWADDIADPRVKSELVANAANYVLEKVPDAVRHFGLSQKGVERLVMGRLPVPRTGGHGGELDG